MATNGPFTYSAERFPRAIATAIEIQKSNVQLENTLTDLNSALDVLRGKCAIDPIKPLADSEIYALLFQRGPIALGLFLLYLRMLDEHAEASHMRMQLTNCICKQYGVEDIDIATFIADQWLSEINFCVYLQEQSRNSTSTDTSV